MCGIAEYSFLPAAVALVVVNVFGMHRYYRFRRRLGQFISQQELARRGELDGETGELVLRFFFLRSYREFGDPELNVLGERARTLLVAGLAAGIVAIVIAVWAQSSSGSWSSVLGCYVS